MTKLFIVLIEEKQEREIQIQVMTVMPNCPGSRVCENSSPELLAIRFESLITMKQLTTKQNVVKLTNNLNYHHHNHLFAFMCMTNFKNIQQVVRRGDLRKPPGL